MMAEARAMGGDGRGDSARRHFGEIRAHLGARAIVAQQPLGFGGQTFAGQVRLHQLGDHGAPRD
jgi:hypothetical protein